MEDSFWEKMGCTLNETITGKSPIGVRQFWRENLTLEDTME